MDTNTLTKNQSSLSARVMRKFILLVLFFLFPAFSGNAGAMEASDIPSLFSAVRIDSQLMFCGEKVELNKNDIKGPRLCCG
jgi:hypothetical protein